MTPVHPASPAARAYGSVSHDTLVTATAQIVSAYCVNRGEASLNLTALMADVYGTLHRLAACGEGSVAAGATQSPVVAIEDSVNEEYLVCLEDGKRVKMLKRHLKTTYGMSPEQYRARWNLPANYPMVAPAYAKVRSKLAKEIGLGHRALRSLPSAKQRMDAAAAARR